MSTTLPGGAAAAPTTSAWKPAVQVPSSHYGSAYEDPDKWLCYYWQICNVLERGSRQVLEIGVGSQVVTAYLRRAGIALTTFDIDPDLRPDFVGSVTEMPFADGSFDAILCTEVLEHMPFDQTQRAMRELARCTRRYAYVAVPHFVLSFALLLRAPLLHLHELRVGVPCPKKVGEPSGQHFWECGLRGFSPARIRRALREAGFSSIRTVKLPTNYSSIFFELEK